MNKRYYGSCHCGGIQFSVDASSEFLAIQCNCSICRMNGYLHLHVKNEALSISSGQHLLTEYRFNTCIATHMFCKVCGVKPFYRPRSHPNDYSVNVNCISNISECDYQVDFFDGMNWEKEIPHFPDQPVAHG